MFECPVEFTLMPSALVGRSALAYRNFGEMQAARQIKVFRALCEYFIFGQNTSFFCSLYNITRAQLKTAVEWVESNLTVKESESVGWFFKSTRLSSSDTQTEVSARFDKNKMAPFWEYNPPDSKYLDVLYDAWMKFKNFEEKGNCYVANGAPAIRTGCFELALISVHLVEEAKAVTPDFLNMQTLNMYITDFKAVASDAIATIIEERTVFISSFDFYHSLADDILLLATHWPDIVGARSFDAENKLASALCECIVVGKPSHNSTLIFCDMDDAPLRVKELQFLLEVTCKQGR